MHEFNAEVEELAHAILEYSLTRLKSDPPLDSPKNQEELYREVGETITVKGMGGIEALRVFTENLAPACISTDHPRYLAFIPSAPSESANLFDLVVGASALYGGSWLEGAGAVYAENQALRWISNLAGMPSSSGGVFVQGGTIGNLSALVAARHTAKKQHPSIYRWVVAASSEAHSSIASAAKVMDVELLLIKPRDNGKLHGEDVATKIKEFHSAHPEARVFAVVGTAGTTNMGYIDDLKGLAKAAHENGAWFHVDGAYGLAALCAPSVRSQFDGIEQCDSMIVDPHKWLFAPYDACALIYRNPQLAKAAHTQHAEYLDTLTESEEWNPSDYAIQLTRRPRGLPFWFSLATHGTRAYEESVEQTLTVAKQAGELIKKHPNLELVEEVHLSIVAFTRKGWSAVEYEEWSNKLLADQIAFVTPSAHNGQPILRFAIVNPWTKISDIEAILETL
jgi:glutamate/tyrosine decarboxylase-like PLP-dependent enzyme